MRSGFFVTTVKNYSFIDYADSRMYSAAACYMTVSSTCVSRAWQTQSLEGFAWVLVFEAYAIPTSDLVMETSFLHRPRQKGGVVRETGLTVCSDPSR